VRIYWAGLNLRRVCGPSIPLCNDDDDCVAGELVCQDTTAKEICVDVQSSSTCTYDADHTCRPLVMLYGTCGDGKCDVVGDSHGGCSPAVVSQCH